MTYIRRMLCTALQTDNVDLIGAIHLSEDSTDEIK